jgi:hypothetical protein
MRFIFSQPEIYVWLFGFLFNFVWEISHMPFYQGFYNFYNKDKSVTKRYWFGENSFEMRKTFAGVFWFASFCDGLLILLYYWLVSLLFWDRYWIISGGVIIFGEGIYLSRWAGYAIATLLALLGQYVIEVIALKRDWWGYSDEMPMLFKHVALLPIIQMGALPALSYILTKLVIVGMDPA